MHVADDFVAVVVIKKNLSLLINFCGALRVGDLRAYQSKFLLD